MRPDDNGKASATGKVVFDPVGSQYFLRAVWTPGSTEHFEAFQSKSEKQALKLQAASHPTAPGVEIAMAQK